MADSFNQLISPNWEKAGVGDAQTEHAKLFKGRFSTTNVPARILYNIIADLGVEELCWIKLL